jgi:hypothetical protein
VLLANYPESRDISSESLEVAEIPDKYSETPKVTDRIVLSVVIFQFGLFTPPLVDF